MADGKPNTPYVPPGYRALITVTIEYDPERVRRWLAEPRMEAFGLDPTTGKEYVVPVELWRSDQAAEILRTGKYRNLVVFVRDFDLPPDFVVQWPDQREGFPPPSAEPIEPAVAPKEDKPAEPIEPGGPAIPLGDDAVITLNEDLAQLAAPVPRQGGLAELATMLSEQNEPPPEPGNDVITALNEAIIELAASAAQQQSGLIELATMLSEQNEPLPGPSEDIVAALNEDLAKFATSVPKQSGFNELAAMLSEQNEPAELVEPAGDTVLPEQSEPAEPGEATLPEQRTLAEPVTPSPSVTRNRRRGRAPLEIWPDLYGYLASEVARMGKKYPSYLKAAEEGERWLWNQNRDHPEERKWRRLPTVDTMREKIAEERSELAEDNCD